MSSSHQTTTKPDAWSPRIPFSFLKGLEERGNVSGVEILAQIPYLEPIFVLLRTVLELALCRPWQEDESSYGMTHVALTPYCTRNHSLIFRSDHSSSQ
jgi:hypothetical protein